jgi:hypothetical protein
MDSVRVTIGRDGEPLRKVPTYTLSVEFQPAGRINGSFSLGPSTENDFAAVFDWINAAFCAEDRLQICIEIDDDCNREMYGGWCVITQTCVNVATSAALSFSVMGRLIPPEAPWERMAGQ